MRSRATVVVMVLAVLFYAVLLGAKGVALLGAGSAAGVLLGLGVLVVPVVGGFVIGQELRFGRRCAALAAVLEAEGGLLGDDLPRTPSGRIDRSSADRWFEEVRAEAQGDPDSWRAWFRLALAYDAAGDRARARSAARHAIALRP